MPTLDGIERLIRPDVAHRPSVGPSLRTLDHGEIVHVRAVAAERAKTFLVAQAVPDGMGSDAPAILPASVDQLGRFGRHGGNLVEPALPERQGERQPANAAADDRYPKPLRGHRRLFSSL